MTVPTPKDLLDLEGTELPPSEWKVVDQARIDLFADATDDHQWIHVDPERAAESPFGSTIAHGFLTLSMLVPLVEEVLVVEQRSSALNYGFEKVRFTGMVPVDGRIRVRATVGEVTEVNGGVQVALDCTIEVEGQERPALVARWLTRQLT